MVFYPDNVSRRDRALQLQNDISLLQNSAKEARDAMTKADARMLPYINQILANNKMSTFDELQAKLNAALTPEQQAQYNNLIKSSAQLTQGTDTALMAMSGILFTSGIVAKAIDIGNFLRAVGLVTMIRGYARAFITLVTEGVEAGARAFRLASTVFKWAEDGLVEASQVAKYASNAGRFLKVLSIVGIFADGFILAFDLYEQKQQRDELVKTIRELFVSRILAKVYARMCDAIKTEDGLMLSYLILVGDDGSIDPDDQRAADKIANKFVSFVKDDWSGITAASSLDLLVVLDTQRGSYTSDDPKYQDAIKDAEDQLAQDPPQSPGSTASVASVSSVMKAVSSSFALAQDALFPPPAYDTVATLNHLADMKIAHTIRAYNDALATKVQSVKN
ncbi:hypothetical protein ONZ45_g5826 [Pleurotus djamor]|nr:hypothetical protein ONZ45_g5826 [Pleurotus djamor]